jgi:hypothetical protein
MSCEVKLPPKVWLAFKDQFKHVPDDVLCKLLDAIEVRLSSAADMRTPVSFIWNCDFCGVQYAASLQVDVHFRGNLRVVMTLRGEFYCVPLPAFGLDA